MKTPRFPLKQKENCSRWLQFGEESNKQNEFDNLNQDNQNRKRGGRPKKSSVALKSKTIAVCFSEPEFYTIKSRAERAKLPLSIFCHDAVLNAQIVEPVKKEEMELLKSLSNMGNNLNQLTKIAHLSGLISLGNEVKDILKSVVQIINKLSHDWKNSKRKKL